MKWRSKVGENAKNTLATIIVIAAIVFVALNLVGIILWRW